MTGILATGVFATASIGGTSGLLEGKPHLLPIQLYGVAVTLGWSVIVIYSCSNWLACSSQSAFRCNRNWKASISRNAARRFSKST
jgi:ammonia channel protein AmtB